MMEKALKRIITFMLIMVMIIGMFPTNATAKSSTSEQTETDERLETTEQTEMDEQLETSDQIETEEQLEASDQIETEEQLEASDQTETEEQLEASDQTETEEQFEASDQTETEEQLEASDQTETEEQLEASDQTETEEQLEASDQTETEEQLEASDQSDTEEHSNLIHTVTNNGKTYDLPNLPTTSDNYILLQHYDSKDVVILVGDNTDYFGSDTHTIYNYDSSYAEKNFVASYISSFNGEQYSEWEANGTVGDFYHLLNYKILYKSKRMYPSYNYSCIVTLPEGVSWNDKIIITYSNGAYRLYKPANNYGMWVDVNNINCNFHYRDTLTSPSQMVSEYIYNTTSHTWTKGTYGRTQGYDYETFYIGSEVYTTDGEVRRKAQSWFYAQSSESQDQDDDLISDVSNLLTNNYVILKSSSSKFLIILIGEDDGYFGSDTATIWNYNSSYSKTNFTASYVSPYDGEKYIGYAKNDIGDSFSLSGYEIVYKSKNMYPISPYWETGHIFTTLPEGVSWDDKIIITYSNGAYRLYKPANNDGIWVDVYNVDCNFYYRNTLTSSDQTVSQYTYNTKSRKWSKGTYGRTQGGPNEIFYVGADVFATDGTIRRASQHDFYAKTPITTVPRFEPLEPSEAKEFLAFITTQKKSEVEQKFPKCYGLLTGTIPATLELKLAFSIFVFDCIKVQLTQCDKTIDLGTTYLIKWVEDNTSTDTIVYDSIMDEVIGDLEIAFFMATESAIAVPAFIATNKLAKDLVDYSMLLANAVGTSLEIKHIWNVNYLRAYINLLEAQYRGDIYEIELCKMDCEQVLLNKALDGNPELMRKYAEYIFSIEHSISSDSSIN